MLKRNGPADKQDAKILLGQVVQKNHEEKETARESGAIHIIA